MTRLNTIPHHNDPYAPLANPLVLACWCILTAPPFPPLHVYTSTRSGMSCLALLAWTIIMKQHHHLAIRTPHHTERLDNKSNTGLHSEMNGQRLSWPELDMICV